MKTFSFNRFVLLLKKEISENIRNVLITIFITLFLVSLMITLEATLTSPLKGIIIAVQNSLKAYYFIGLFVLSSAFAGFSFPALRKTEKTINYLSLPASAFEKFLSYFTLSTIGFFTLYSILFFIFYSIVITVIGSYGEEIAFFPYYLSDFFTYFTIYINLNAIFLLGATVFKRTPPFFTILYVGLVSLSLFLILASLMSLSQVHNIYTSEGKMLTEGFSQGIRIDDTIFYQILKYLSIFGLAIFFWFVGYLKLKEKEV